MRLIVTALVSLLLLSVLSSCSIFNSELEVEKRISLYFSADQVDEDIVRQQDSLRIREVKFSVERFNLIGENIELGSSNNIRAFIFNYNQSSDDVKLVIDVGVGIADNITFNGYKMFLRPVANSADVRDNDFFGEEQNYSVIISGRYNDKNFTYRSSGQFDKEFSYDNVEVDNVAESLVIIKSLDMSEVFIGEDDLIIDPTNAENDSLIFNNIETGLQIEAYSSNLR